MPLRRASLPSTCCVLGVLLLAGCGGGGGSDGPQVQTLTGYFVDAPVAGVTYATATQSGVTGANGAFSYVAGERVRFAIGDIELGNAAAGETVTPVDLVSGAADETDNRVTNMVRLLMTLDADGDASNGIQVPERAATAATGVTLDFDMAPEAFSTDAALSGYLAAANVSASLVDAQAAQRHLDATLDGFSSWGQLTFGSSVWRASN